MFDNTRLLDDARLPLVWSEEDLGDEGEDNGNKDNNTQYPPNFGAHQFPPPPKVEFVDHAPIERKGIQGRSAVRMYVLLFLALIAIPFSVFGIRGKLDATLFDIIGFALCFAFLFHLSRSAKHSKGIVPLIVFFGIFLFLLTGTSAIILMALSTLFAISQGSFALAVARKKHIPLLLLIPAAAYGVSVGIGALLGSPSPLMCALCLLPVPATVVLSTTARSSAKRDGITRVGSICATSLALGVTVAVPLAIILYLKAGAISLTTVKAAIESFRDMMLASLTSVEADMGNGIQQVISDDAAAELVNSTVNILPGTLIAVLNIFVFFAQVILLGTLRTWGVVQKPVRKMYEFSMSFMAAIVFAIALIIFLFDSGYKQSTPIGTVANNLTIIFQPGLALCGVDSLTRFMVEKRIGCGLVLLAIAILAFSMTMGLLLTVLAAVGAFFIIKKFISDMRKKDNQATE